MLHFLFSFVRYIVLHCSGAPLLVARDMRRGVLGWRGGAVLVAGCWDRQVVKRPPPRLSRAVETACMSNIAVYDTSCVYVVQSCRVEGRLCSKILNEHLTK